MTSDNNKQQKIINSQYEDSKSTWTNDSHGPVITFQRWQECVRNGERERRHSKLFESSAVTRCLQVDSLPS